jgi:hypothetical protein
VVQTKDESVGEGLDTASEDTPEVVVDKDAGGSCGGQEAAEETEAVRHVEEAMGSLEKAVFVGRMEKMARTHFLARAHSEAEKKERNELIGVIDTEKGGVTVETDSGNDIVDALDLDLDYAVRPNPNPIPLTP